MEHKAEKVWKNLVWQDKDRMSGAPCIYGTEVRVEDLFDSISRGRTVDEFVQAFPTVPRATVVAIIEEAGNNLKKHLEMSSDQARL